MNGNLFHRFLPSCHHQFSWPRRGEHGDYYQCCVHCGDKYGYDWSKMRRLSPVSEDEEEPPDRAKSSNRKCGSVSAWVRRERRLRYRVPVRFRVTGAEEWIEGVSENVSRSGLLFSCGVLLTPGTALELRFQLPREIAEVPTEALCQAAVVRAAFAAPTRKQKPSYLTACAISYSELVGASDTTADGSPKLPAASATEGRPAEAKRPG